MANAAGIMAKKAASAVIVTGRTRSEAALRIASVGLSPSPRRNSWAQSVISTAFDTLMPTTKIMPNSDCTLRAVPVTYSSVNTPISESGTASITVSGTTHERTRATIRK